MYQILAVGIGGFTGAVLRYLSCMVAYSLPAHNHYLATFFVNFLGCFFIGFIAQYDFKAGTLLKPFLITGLLGGFTTYSAFGLETMHMIKDAQITKAAFYIIGTVLFCLAAVFLGSLTFKYTH